MDLKGVEQTDFFYYTFYYMLILLLPNHTNQTMISCIRVCYLCFFPLFFVLTGCTSPTKTEINPEFTPAQWITPKCFAASETPNPCTGWDCEISGIIYLETAEPGNEMGNVNVKLSQYSWCSPTAGEQETISDEGGEFSFSVFIHDTDTFLINVNMAQFKAAENKLVGFDCLYCSCPDIIIVMRTIENP